MSDVQGDMTTVLIADDDDGIRELLRELLDSEGYLVEEATNGAEAIELVTANPPGAVLMDLMMPVVSGAEATTMLKQDPRTASIPVLVMSAGRNIAAMRNEIPADDFISKPFDLSSLVSAIANLTRRDGD
jgi:CheY-like chemotaxis protein